MSSQAWTEKQYEAINDRSHNLLVSAAAGSGKTAVLVERIKKLVIEDHINIDEMLVVTFTEAAASEMKTKIYKALLEAGLSDQIDRMGRSSISSFDSFAYSVVKRYYQLIGLDPSLSTCDGTSAALLKEEALDDLYEEMFERKDKDFLYFLDCYEQRPGDSAVRDMILGMHAFLMSMPNPWDWAEDFSKIDEDEIDGYLNFAKEEVLVLLSNAKENYQKFSDALLNAGLVKLAEKAKADVSYVDDLMATIESNLDLGFNSLMETHRVASMPSKDEGYLAIADEIKPYRDSAKEFRDKAKELASGLSRKALQKEAAALSPVLAIFFKLVKRFDEIYKEKKAQKKCLDFSDMEHFALEILENELPCKEYKEKFKYVFVDEYQDTNSVQEALIEKIVSGDNLFMVGDVKQCIYKFRLAEPELFMKHYEEYESGKDPVNKLINLNSNFRSKKEIIDTVNNVFSKVMTKESCGMEYDDNAALVLGSKYEGDISYSPKLHILDNSDENEVDDLIADLKKNELAAMHAVSIIKDYHGKTIYDEKLGKERQLKYKDMVVLLRATKNVGEVYYKAFLDANIPVYLDRGEGYFDTLEIDVFLNLLKIIDNRKQDIPLLSVLTCPVFGFSAEELANVRLCCKEGPFYEAFFEYAKTNEKAKAFLNRLDEYKKQSKILPLADFIYTLMLTTGYADFESAKNGGEQRLANLKALVEKAENFEKNNLSGLTGFISFAQMLSKRGGNIDIGQAKLVSESMDCVRIMTIHKSKGLEFPFVLVAGMSDRMSGRSDSKLFEYHKEFGAAIRLVNLEDDKYTDTQIAKLIRYKKQKEARAEKIRLLYVAMTRAKDILCFSAYADAKKNSYSDINNAKSYLELIMPTLSKNQISICDKNSLASFIYQGAQADAEFEKELLSSWTDAKDEKVDTVLGYKYFDEASNVKKKYSVSEIAEEARERNKIDIPYEVPLFIQGSSRKMTGAEKGTAYHLVMEHIPFTEKAKDASYVKEFISSMLAQNLLTQDQANAIDPRRVSAFFETEIGKRALKSNEVHKEAPFVMKHDYQGKEILVQGTIDCYFEEDGQYVLVDYKSNYIDLNDKEESLKHLKESYLPQLALYKEALEKITGKTVKEGVLYLFGLGESLEIEG